MTTIYILKLQKNKYYIGKSNNHLKRIKQHFDEDGCSWTKYYKPIDVEKVLKNADEFDEDKWVKKYMLKYGIDNVRGGSYSQITLSNEIKNLLMRELKSIKNVCFNCGSDKHFINDCEKDEEWEDINEEESQEDEEEEDMNDINEEESHYQEVEEEITTFIEWLLYQKRCFKCGRKGHKRINCYAKTYDSKLNDHQVNILDALKDFKF